MSKRELYKIAREIKQIKAELSRTSYAQPTQGVVYTLGYKSGKNKIIPLREKVDLNEAMALMKKLDSYKRAVQKAFNKYDGGKLDAALDRIDKNSISSLGFPPYTGDAQNYIAIIDKSTGESWYRHGAGGEPMWYLD